MARLADYAKKQAEGVPLRLEDIEGIPVVIQDIHVSKGQFGMYAVMTVVNPNGEILEVMTGAQLVLDALMNVQKDNAFPVDATFSRKGRTWIVSD